jgi:hypothetical protein
MIHGVVKAGAVVQIDPNKKWAYGYEEHSGKEFVVKQYVDKLEGRLYISPFKVSGNPLNYYGYAVYHQKDLIAISGVEPVKKSMLMGLLLFPVKLFLITLMLCSVYMFIGSITGKETLVLLPFSIGFFICGMVLFLRITRGRRCKK